MKNIVDHPEFKAVNEPLRNLNREIAEIKAQQEKNQTELSRLAANAESESAWEKYLKDVPGALAQRDSLRAEGTKLEGRLRMLEEAREQGRAQVETVRARLSREPCREERSAIVTDVQEIFAALDQILEANRRLTARREALEAAGYRTSSLSPAQFDLSGRVESYRAYIGYHYAELAPSKKRAA